MPRGAVVFADGSNTHRVEPPITFRAYLITAFAAFGGILFGYDIGYINGVMGIRYFIHQFTGLPYPSPTSSNFQRAAFVIPSSKKSLIVSILSAGTFFGSLIAGDLADHLGRRTTIILGCIVFSLGVALQTAATAYGMLVAGRMIAGLGVGFMSAIIILYMSEIAPRKVRGAIVSGYQFCITIGILLASCVTYATQDYKTSISYRIPIAVQFLWALILGIGLFLLPESPRFYIMTKQYEKAADALARIRGQPQTSEYVQQELAEITANHEHELWMCPQEGYVASWANCFKGCIKKPSSNLRRTILGTSLQMMQQWTGINFIFYFGTTFFQQLNISDNPFLISLITTLVNVCSTPVSFWIIERFGRRSILIWGAFGMVICEVIVAVAGTVDGNNPATVRAQVSFICIYIFFFATTWGPGAWVVIGEIFPLPLWNCVIAVITPYMVDRDRGNLGSKVFFIWGVLCLCCLIYAYYLVPETKGLTLEQVDQMLEQTTPRTSAQWRPARAVEKRNVTGEKDASQLDEV